MRKIKISFSIIYWLIILALIIIAASTALSVFKVPGGISLFSVQSGSMEPTINIGSVVLIQKQVAYKEGDIITFLGINKKDTTTHRILAIKNANGEKIFITKGDANRGEDRETIKEKQILGKVFFSAPYFGYVVSFAKTQIGFIFLIVVPAVIIIFSEILNIKKEILKIIEKKKMPVDATKILTLLLLIVTIIIFSASTKAYLSDKEKSENNILQAGTWGIPEPSVTPTVTPTPSSSPSPTPIPGIADHVVISEVQIDGGIGQANDNDFIELYNPTYSPFNLSGYRLVKRTGNAPNDTNIFTFTSSHIVPAHGYFLWANSDFTTIPSTPDVTSSDKLGASNSVAIRQGDLDTGTIIDALSWDPGASSLKEGSQFPSNPGINQSMERKAYSTSTQVTMEGGADAGKGNGFDLNDNATDFVLRGTSQPQNSGNATETP